MCPRAHHETDVRQTTRNHVWKHTATTRIIQVPKSSSENVAATERKQGPLWLQRFSIRPMCKSDLGAANFGRDLVLPKWTCTSRIASLRGKYKRFGKSQTTDKHNSKKKGVAERVRTRITYYKSWRETNALRVPSPASVLLFKLTALRITFPTEFSSSWAFAWMKFDTKAKFW